MKILLGLDFPPEGPDGKEAPAAVRLLKQVRFSKAEVEVAHVVRPYGTPEPGLHALLVAAGEDVEQAYAEERAAAQYLVDRSAAKVGASDGSEPHGIVLVGRAAASLMSRADDSYADLIAVNGSGQASLLDKLLTPSVARAIVVGAHQSVLVARDRPIGPAGANPRRCGGLRAVLATDHSPYANRCIELLCRFAPAGIEHLDVLTAYPAEQIQIFRSLVGDMVVDPADAIHDNLAKRNDTVIDILSHHLTGTTFASHVAAVTVQEAIAQRMAESDADLLILGAKGHGFVERILLGSVSFHHAVVNHPYSVLILRALARTRNEIEHEPNGPRLWPTRG